MAMEKDPDKVNDDDEKRRQEAEHDAAVSNVIWKTGQSYAARNARSATENEGRKKERDGMEALDLDANAFATVVRLVKTKTPREQKRWIDTFMLAHGILSKSQQELFPAETVRMNKREQDRKAKEKAEREAQQELEAQQGRSPDHPRSDPASGGAGTVTAEKTAKKSTKKPAAKSKAKKAAKKADKPQGEVVDLGAARTAKDAAGAAAKNGDAMIRDQIARRQAESEGMPGGSPGEMKSPEETEQAQGDDVFKHLMPQTGTAAEAARPISQTEQARQKLEEAGLDGSKPH